MGAVLSSRQRLALCLKRPCSERFGVIDLAKERVGMHDA